VEDSLLGLPEISKKCKKLGIFLRFGLRISCRNSDSESDVNSDHKIIIFALTKNARPHLNRIFSHGHVKNNGFITFDYLKSIWTKDLLLAIPFYDSFIHKNNFTFSNCVPDFSFCTPIFFIEDNNVSYDQLLKDKVLEFVNKFNYETFETKTIYYKEKKDVFAMQAYKIICDTAFGKNRSLQKPELKHFGSDEFCYESFLEKENNVKI
jgi:DNA polymerase III alpha subunit